MSYIVTVNKHLKYKKGERKTSRHRRMCARDNAPLSSCNDNEEYGSTNVALLVCGSSQTFHSNVLTPSTMHKKISIVEDFVVGSTVKLPTMHYQSNVTALLVCHLFS